jgi:hypothetical protein
LHNRITNLARAADRLAWVLVGARAPFRAPADSVDYAPLESRGLN